MEKLYYLREGDFLPEPIESICDSWHRSRKDMIDFLSKNNNLFTSKEEATNASCAIRAVLSAVTAHKGHQSTYQRNSYGLRYYLRLFRKLFWHYTRSGMDSDTALRNACKSFEFLAGFEYCDIYKRYS